MEAPDEIRIYPGDILVDGYGDRLTVIRYNELLENFECSKMTQYGHPEQLFIPRLKAYRMEKRVNKDNKKLKEQDESAR